MNNRSPQSQRISTTATAVKKSTMLFKAATITLISLTVIITVSYIISFFYQNLFSFTVSVQKYDMVKQGLSLSESDNFKSPISRLDASSVKDCTNISGDDIPDNVDAIDGQHNGTNYVAYTFYLKNMGEDTVTYEYSINLSNVTKGVDEAVRFRLFQNGENVTYAKTKMDGSGPEEGTEEFSSLATVTQKQRRGFEPDTVDKYTIVIWLEGDDPECVDAIIGGQFKADMKFEIVEGS